MGALQQVAHIAHPTDFLGLHDTSFSLWRSFKGYAHRSQCRSSRLRPRSLQKAYARRMKRNTQKPGSRSDILGNPSQEVIFVENVRRGDSEPKQMT
jgi:hypothetical protein